MSAPALAECRFETPRLLVAPSSHVKPELAVALAAILTDEVTQDLPPGWQGAYDEARARAWLQEREREGGVYLVTQRDAGELSGVLLLHAPRGGEVRIGYFLGTAWWGRGLATELIAGLVGWALGQPGVQSLSGGVDAANVASIRVLEKNAFTRGDADAGRDADTVVLVRRV